MCCSPNREAVKGCNTLSHEGLANVLNTETNVISSLFYALCYSNLQLRLNYCCQNKKFRHASKQMKLLYTPYIYGYK